MPAKHPLSPLPSIKQTASGTQKAPKEGRLPKTGTVRHTRMIKFDGKILVDKPDCLETLSLVEAMMADRKPGDGPCIFIAPRSCYRQWFEEIERRCDTVSWRSSKEELC